MVRIILAVLILALAGCAAPQKGYVKKVEVKHDLGSQIDLAITYHERDNGSIVVSDSHNQRGRLVRLWFWHQQETEGQKVLRGIRFYEGNKVKHREVFQVPPAETGLTETFWIEAYGEEGERLMESKPIVNSNSQKGGMP